MCTLAYINIILMCACVHYTGRDYQERATVSGGQGQGTSSGTAATKTAGEVCVCVSRCSHDYSVCVCNVLMTTDER